MTVSGGARHPVLRWGLRVTLGIVVLALVVYAALWALQRKLIYQPDSSAVPPAEEIIPGAEDVTLHTDDDLTLGAWLVPADPATDRGLAVLFAPGNGGNRAGRSEWAALLSARGFTVLMLDYRGYGGNPGAPSEEGLASDAQAASEFLTQQGFSAKSTIYFGESLGCAVVARLQAEIKPAGMVLRSPFTDLATVAESIIPLVPISLLLRDDFPVTAYIADSDVPISVVWGSEDTLVDPSLSHQVADAAKSAGNLVESLEVPGVDHDDPALVGPEVADVVVRLADSIA